MIKNIQKMIVMPIDGSANALKSLDYVYLVFGPRHNLKATLFYVLPDLPATIVEEGRKDPKILKKVREVESRNTEMAKRFLKVAQEKLVNMGFSEKAVENDFQKIEVGIARDIVDWSEKKRADAVILSTRGHSKLVTFFLGEIAIKVLEYSRVYFAKGLSAAGFERFSESLTFSP